jgi:hypothetical protein
MSDVQHPQPPRVTVAEVVGSAAAANIPIDRPAPKPPTAQQQALVAAWVLFKMAYRAAVAGVAFGLFAWLVWHGLEAAFEHFARVVANVLRN